MTLLSFLPAEAEANDSFAWFCFVSLFRASSVAPVAVSRNSPISLTSASRSSLRRVISPTTSLGSEETTNSGCTNIVSGYT